MKYVKLLKAEDNYRYLGKAEYFVLYDYSSGKKNLYNVFIKTSSDPVRIGCEIPLDSVRRIVGEFEALIKKGIIYFGDRKTALHLLKTFKQRG